MFIKLKLSKSLILFCFVKAVLTLLASMRRESFSQQPYATEGTQSFDSGRPHGALVILKYFYTANIYLNTYVYIPFIGPFLCNQRCPPLCFPSLSFNTSRPTLYVVD